VIANGAPAVGLDQAMRGYVGTNWVAMGAPGTAPANWVSGTGVFHVTRADSQGVNVDGPMATDNANISISSNPTGIVAEQALLISDCERADLFRATNTPSSGSLTIAHTGSNCAVIGGVPCNVDPTGAPTNKLSKLYGPDAEVYGILSTTYFIGMNVAGNPALYRRQQLGTQTGAAEELVDNVENIVMRFGIDTVPTDNNLVVSSYASASDFPTGSWTDWRQVLTARLSLVFRGNSTNVATQVQPCVVENASCPSAFTDTSDRRLRQVATTTIGLRNRLP
jgi:type IV pilus assembly protein PilW